MSMNILRATKLKYGAIHSAEPKTDVSAPKIPPVERVFIFLTLNIIDYLVIQIIVELYYTVMYYLNIDNILVIWCTRILISYVILLTSLFWIFLVQYRILKKSPNKRFFIFYFVVRDSGTLISYFK